MEEAKDKVYIALDVEATGPILGEHSLLSFGACVVTPDDLVFDELAKRRLTFYKELKPISIEFDPAAMRVGCLGLDCLVEMFDHVGLDCLKKGNCPTYDPNDPAFNPRMVLTRMFRVCTSPEVAIGEFLDWTDEVAQGREVVPVVDAAFFDPGWLNWYLGLFGRETSPFGHKGIDLDSFYKGRQGDLGAKLSELGITGDPRLRHRADHDAFVLSLIARKLFWNI